MFWIYIIVFDMCVNGGLNFVPVRLSSIYLWQLAAVPTDHLHPLIPSPDNTVFPHS